VKYPQVRNELLTIRHILETGCSIARFGDGEVKLMDNGSQIREPQNPKLAAELRDTMVDPDPRCIVGIPTMDPHGPKFKNWEARQERTVKFLNPAMQYYSSFISRPDSAPWILTRDDAAKVCDIWRGKKTAIICEADNKLLDVVRKTTEAKVKHFTCPHTETYKVIDALEIDMIRGRFDCVVMSCGPAATCLARRLSKQGVQAIDLGSAGGFLRKLLDLEPLGDQRTVILQRPEDMTVAQMKAKLEREWNVRYFDEKDGD
jgi:hypothetical protein